MTISLPIPQRHAGRLASRDRQCLDRQALESNAVLLDRAEHGIEKEVRSEHEQ